MASRKKSVKLIAAPCPIAIRKGDAPDLLDLIEPNDVVMIAKDPYAHIGVDTNSDKDTRKLFSSPGQIYWLDPNEAIGKHPSGRKMGLKLFGMLSTLPKTKKAGDKATAKKDGPILSQVL